jgi:hypothetical protein
MGVGVGLGVRACVRACMRACVCIMLEKCVSHCVSHVSGCGLIIRGKTTVWCALQQKAPYLGVLA